MVCQLSKRKKKQLHFQWEIFCKATQPTPWVTYQRARTHSAWTGEATHNGSSTYPIEHTFYGPSRHVNLGLVGNQQNEWSANMYTFRRHLMFHEYLLSEIFIKNYNLS